jgi:hypothetical protein
VYSVKKQSEFTCVCTVKVTYQSTLRACDIYVIKVINRITCLGNEISLLSFFDNERLSHDFDLFVIFNDSVVKENKSCSFLLTLQHVFSQECLWYTVKVKSLVYNIETDLMQSAVSLYSLVIQSELIKT